MVVQRRDDKKDKTYEPFKLKSAMLDLDEYVRIFIIPQIPAGFSDFRDSLRACVEKAWRSLYMASATSGRERQKRLMEFKVEMSMIDTYLKEIRDVCYRGKEKRRLDKTSARRFEICADKQHAVLELVWGWIKNEHKKLDSAKTQKTAGLMEGVEVA